MREGTNNPERNADEEGKQGVLMPGLAQCIGFGKPLTMDKWQNKDLLSVRNPDSLTWRESSYAHAVGTCFCRLGFWSGRRTDAA